MIPNLSNMKTGTNISEHEDWHEQLTKTISVDNIMLELGALGEDAEHFVEVVATLFVKAAIGKYTDHMKEQEAPLNLSSSLVSYDPMDPDLLHTSRWFEETIKKLVTLKSWPCFSKIYYDEDDTTFQQIMDRLFKYTLVCLFDKDMDEDMDEEVAIDHIKPEKGVLPTKLDTFYKIGYIIGAYVMCSPWSIEHMNESWIKMAGKNAIKHVINRQP